MQWFRKHRKQLLLAGGYAVTAVLLDLSSGAFVLQTGLAICYPPAGLYLAAIILLGWWALPLAFLNPVFSVLVTLQSPDIHPIAVIGIGAASMVSPAIVLALLRKISPTGIRLNTIRDIVSFSVVTLLATTIESLVAAWVYIQTGLGTPDAFGTIATGWWISNIIPFLTLTPVILLWHQGWPDRQAKNYKITLQAVLIVVITPLAVLVALFANGSESISRLYVAFLPILWAALVGGITGAAWESLTLTTTILILSPALLFEPGTVVEAQFFLLVAALTGLATGAIVTERRQAEIDLRKSENKYRAIIDNAIDGIFQSTPDGRLISVNPAMARMYGYASPQEMVNSVTDIANQIYIDPAARDRLRIRIESGEEIRAYEALEYRKDKSKLWTSMNAQVIRDEDGSTLYYEGTVEDITLRKEIEIKRKEAETLYRSLVEQTSIVAYRLSPDASASSLYISPQIQTMLGYSVEEWLSEPSFWKKIVHPQDLPSVLADVEHYLSKKDKSSIEYRIRNKAGDWRWVRDETVVVTNETGDVQFVHGVFLDITERKQAENSLLQFRKLMDESNDAFFLIDPQTSRYIDFNKSAYEKLGYSREELSLLGVVDIAEHVTNLDVWSERVALVREKGDLIFESNYRRKDGTKFPTEISARMLEHGGETIMVANVRDITKRKQAEASLLQFRKLMDESNDAIFIIDPETSLFIDFNRTACKLFGYTREEFSQLGVINVAEHVTNMEDWVERVALVREKNGFIFEGIYRRKDGTTFPTEVSVGILTYEDKSNLVTILRDITERKQAETEREKLIGELETKNAETETLRQSFASIVGTFEFTEIIQQILAQIGRVVPFDSASVWRLEGNIQKLIASRNLPLEPIIEEMEIRIDEINSALPILHDEIPYILNHNVQAELLDFKDPPHNIINSWLAVPLKTRGKIIGLIALDGYRKNQFNEHHAQLAVTFANQVAIALENARLFSELQNELYIREKLIKELESKNAELERFTYTVSHDLKSPLVTINGFLGYLKGDMASSNPDRASVDIQRIQDAVDKMHLLLRELLELSRIGRIVNPPEKILFEDLVRDALEIVHGLLEARGVTVQILSPQGAQPSLPAIQGDRQRLTEVLQNLIDNAAKYMGDQITPRIEIGQHGEEHGQLIFFVKDNGMGISPQYHERIFGLFDKLDSKSEGTGVGLALVKRIIEIHGGRIWVEGEVGKGSTFYFTIPSANY